MGLIAQILTGASTQRRYLPGPRSSGPHPKQLAICAARSHERRLGHGHFAIHSRRAAPLMACPKPARVNEYSILIQNGHLHDRQGDVKEQVVRLSNKLTRVSISHSPA